MTRRSAHRASGRAYGSEIQLFRGYKHPQIPTILQLTSKYHKAG
ncbi:Uncharacterised protein [BD1-7 clade bacterium]|uniref:Uncharacterized protein n=1 Tax=BD1-7 clade bacterium TaxID=2029982 RepID=A0A5S9Q4V8_9GAMM|nr:Uncharacterised protein [BD1-7 clade bacterium]